MTSPEKSYHSEEPPTKAELLRELSTLDTQIQPYLETALAIDEIRNYEHLLEEKEAVLDDLENFDS